MSILVSRGSQAKPLLLSYRDRMGVKTMVAVLWAAAPHRLVNFTVLHGTTAHKTAIPKLAAVRT
jgi:hypothetical protein